MSDYIRRLAEAMAAQGGYDPRNSMGGGAYTMLHRGDRPPTYGVELSPEMARLRERSRVMGGLMPAPDPSRPTMPSAGNVLANLYHPPPFGRHAPVEDAGASPSAAMAREMMAREAMREQSERDRLERIRQQLNRERETMTEVFAPYAPRFY